MCKYNRSKYPTETKDCCEESVADLKNEGDGSRLIEVFYSHADHVEENKNKDRNLKTARNRNIVEQSMIGILRPFDNFLRFLSPKFLHSCVVMLLALC